MIRLRRIFTAPSLSISLACALGSGCVSLSYDEPVPAEWTDSGSRTASESPQDAWTAVAVEPASTGDAPDAAAAAGSESTDESATSAPRRRETPTRARLADQRRKSEESEPARSWRELARMARESAQEGQLERADELLAQAALQLADRKPTNTQRRTVFGMRARLAHDLAALGKPEAADALADQLFSEVRREPALGDTALVTLAQATAARRREAAKAEGREDSQLPLLELALETARFGTASRDRLNLAFAVSNLALEEGRFDLARDAIDQAVIDAQIIAPADHGQAGALKVYKARIALAQRDLGAAEAAANTAVEAFKTVGADPSSQGVAEATLAQIVAEKGDKDRSLEIARGAYARLSGSDRLVDHARRQIAASLARVELLAGDRDAAGAHYREALAVPADGSDRDAFLIRSVKAALADLETSSAANGAP